MALETYLVTFEHCKCRQAHHLGQAEYDYKPNPLVLQNS